MKPVSIHQGKGPLVLGFPHGGTYVPKAIASKMNQRGQGLDDTDWHIAQLYAGLDFEATTVEATFHRYVIDANRDPAGQSLYPGQNTTTLCPLTDFDGRPIWKDGEEPSVDDIEQRTLKFHAPYHDALSREIERVKAIHGFALLYDCHSIRSHIPFLFDGKLPDFSIGTNEGVTCAPELAASVLETCEKVQGYTSVLNGRFKGGWTTRHYGQPARGIHAIQMELAQSTYMIERAPWNYVSEIATQTRTHLKKIFQTLSNWRPQ
jgi:N-formylglutamate deformylase|tara:strand:- start:461 stop:1249 length:789 start_codon:yes stop_codon:yes gene_type:complete